MKFWRVSIALLASLALVATAAACGGGGDDDDGGDNGESSNSPRPTRTPRPTATPDPDEAPVFAAGRWTAGEATVTVSGGASATVTGTLLERSSLSEGEQTRLTYAKGVETISISFGRQYQDPFAMSVYQAPVYIDEGTCEVTYKSKEEKRIEGSFKCTEVDVEQGGNGAQTTVEGTFLATR